MSPQELELVKLLLSTEETYLGTASDGLYVAILKIASSLAADATPAGCLAQAIVKLPKDTNKKHFQALSRTVGVSPTLVHQLQGEGTPIGTLNPALVH